MRSPLLLLTWATLLAGCLPDSRFPDAPDFDGDGVTIADGDCDDTNELIHPDTVWHNDADGDGFGSLDDTQTACEQPSGFVLDATDCDDANQGIYPGAPETCDGVDQDCNDVVDDNPTDTATYYLDADSDGFGDAATATTACEPPTGYVTNADDCDDDDALVNPDGTEACNGYDDDCDGTTDENDAVDVTTWYADDDADTYGDDADSIVACDQPTGYTDRGGDCNDADDAYNPGVVESDCTDPNDYNCDEVVAFVDADSDGFAACVDCADDDDTVNPDATEVCNGKDDDCSGQIDGDDATDADTYYLDGDNDGYGLDSTTAVACAKPSGYAEAGGDCDDASTDYNPGATEDDCTDPEDYNCDGVTAFADVDGDGFAACEECDDTDAAIKPGATEVCDGVDNDCDSTTDEPDATDAKNWYLDSDGDGYGTGTATLACDAPSADHVDKSGDCDDADTAYNPGVTETDCSDPNDYNCDGSVGFVDGDDDGFAACEECDDTNALNNPDADERCDGVDNDCDSVVDEVDAVDVKTWYVDADTDGYGDEGTTDTKVQCNKPTGYAATSDDCDDTRKSVNPGAAEVCDSLNLDEDCDGDADDDDAEGASGKVRYYPDTDADGYGDSASSGTQYCDVPTSGWVLNKLDCNDGNVAINPAAIEQCDTGNVDEDCDGLADDLDSTASGKSLYYTDGDGDGYGATTSGGTAYCDPPSSGVSTNKTDCNDTRDDINPGEVEVCDSANTDENCNTLADDADSGATGKTTYYADDDGDTYGDMTDAGTDYCDPPSDVVTDHTDCNDANNAIKPGATEGVADGVDQNCDTKELCYLDDDNDGYRPDATSTIESADLDCLDTDEAVSTDPTTDCDDTNAAIKPGGTETVADGIDQDCDDVDSCYTDADNDGYGTTVVVDGLTLDCVADANRAANDDDCLDSGTGAASIYPGASETVADGIDQDCDTVDSCYTDADNDGYGTTVVVDGLTLNCVTDANRAANDDDCLDTGTGAASINPGATETVADGVDQDCDSVDSCYTDADNDGYGTTVVVDGLTLNCVTDANRAANDDDCLDSGTGAAAINPGATETVADGIDQDCDTVDSCYTDSDNDGYGTTVVIDGLTLDCVADSGRAANDDDCLDTGTGAASINPGATETVADGIDQDCDTVDSCYTDADNDGYGTTVVVDGLTKDCVADASRAANDDDCLDTGTGAASINPGATETVADGVDQDCDTVDSCYTDSDNDGYGTTTVIDGLTLDCVADANRAAVSTDCDDTSSPDIYPGAPETVADGIDQDCDTVDSCYTDADNDGYGTTVVVDGLTTDCVADANRAAVSTDCLDTGTGAAAVYPGAPEVVADGVDQSCDTKELCYADVDADGYGDGGSTVESTDLDCADAGEANDDDDCNDGAADAYPGAPELCDGKRNDCNDTAWTDDGVVSYHPTSGAASNVTSSFTGAYSLPTSGTLQICAGTYATTLTDAGGATTIDIMADGVVSVLGFDLTNASTNVYALGVDVENTSAVGVSVSDATLELDGSLIDGTSAGTNGAVEVLASGALTLTDSIVSNYDGQSAMYVENSTLTLDGTLVTDNTSSVDGGGLYLNGGTASCIGAGTAEGFHGNAAAGNGGAVYVAAGTFSATTCDFGADGVVGEDNTPNDIYVGTGGIAYDYADDTTITSCTNLVCTP